MNHTISLICIIALTLAWAGVGLYYYLRQNRSDKIGGSISIPKSFWLTFALYLYVILPMGFYVVYKQEEPWKHFLEFVLAIIALRIIVQSYKMYVAKNWRTKHGVAFNVGTAVLVLVFLLSVGIRFHDLFGLNPKAAPAWFYYLYGCIMAATLLTDSYYAVEFNKLVGANTMGDKAVWFASNDPKYDRINGITKRNNYIFIVAIVLTMMLYIMNYDQF